MAITGYVKDPESIKDIDRILDQMTGLGCQRIVKEDTSVIRQRVKWRYILEKKTDGDTIIIYKLSNALGGWVELPMFLNLCLKGNIRLISLDDHLDTEGELFNTSVNDFIPVLISFGNEVYARKPKFMKEIPPELTGSVKREQKKHEKRLWEKAIVNDYQSDISLDIICANRGVAESTLFRILRRNGLKPDRHVFREQMTKRKKLQE